MLYYSLRFLTAYFVFLYPSYAAFKSLTHRPLSEPELERWTKHFCVLGCVVALEYTGIEIFVEWLPFYSEIKFLFLLFLALPQTQGSSYIYDLYFVPFLVKNEADIDAHIASASSNILTFLQTRFAGVFRAVYDAVTRAQSQTNANAQRDGRPPSQSPLGITVPVQLAASLWNTFGSMVAGAKPVTPTRPTQVPMPSQADVSSAARVPLPATPGKAQ